MLKAFLALPLVAAALRCCGLKRLQTVLNYGRTGAADLPVSAPGMEQARVTARLVQASARHCLFRPNCLQQSLVLWWLLRRQGVAGELRIGVRPEVTGLEAHAWVEFQGVPLNDGADVHQRFAPFAGAISPEPMNSPHLG